MDCQLRAYGVVACIRHGHTKRSHGRARNRPIDRRALCELVSLPCVGASLRWALGARFWRLMGATAVSSVGDGLLNVALPLLTASISTNGLAVAGVLAAGRGARAVCAIPAGVVVDRVSRHTVLFTCLVLPAVALGLLGLDLTEGRGDLVAVYLCAVVLAACRVAYDLALQASVPELAAGDLLPTANSRLQSTEITGEQFVGPVVGGLVFSVARRLPVLGDAFSFVLAAVLIGVKPRKARSSNEVSLTEARVRESSLVGASPAPVAAMELFEPTGPEDLLATSEPVKGNPAREGFAFYRRSKALLLLTVVVGTNGFSQAAVLGLLVLYGERQLHLSAGGYGVFFALAAAFGVVGAAFGGRLHRRFGTANLFLAGSAGIGVGLALMSYMHWAVFAVLAMGVQEFSTGVANVGSVTARQRLVPEHLYGRVVSVYRAAVGAAVPAGALLAGASSQWFGIPVTFLAAGILALASVVLVGPRLRPLLLSV